MVEEKKRLAWERRREKRMRDKDRLAVSCMSGHRYKARGKGRNRQMECTEMER